MRRFSSLFVALQGHLPWIMRARAWLRQEIVNGVVLAPVEPILHASRWRLGWIGFFLTIGQPLFGWIWIYWLPQPWDNLPLRFAAGALGAVLLVLAFQSNPVARSTQIVFNLIWWIELPLLFSWMYHCNGGNAVWLASCVAMILIYYQAIDWRLATLGMALGVAAAWLLFLAFGPQVPVHDDSLKTNVAVLLFTWCCATVLGFSTANQRRLYLRRTLTTVGIMAHELRTPLATVSLISQALQTIARSAENAQTADTLESLAARLATLTRNMNHQIDTQIANARMLRLTPVREPVQAGPLVCTVVDEFPFHGERERRAVVVQVSQDFVFNSSRALFAQVVENLLKNALKATLAADRPLFEGDIRIDVSVSNGRGRLLFSDRGVGLAPALRHRIFEPFFSSDDHTGHGLGLAFCKRVVLSAGGTIRVESMPGQGADFYIDLPLVEPQAAAAPSSTGLPTHP